MAAAAPLVLAAHGSTDARFAAVVESLAALVASRRGDLDVRIGYLDHGTPLETVAEASCIVVPVLLTSGFHVRADIPRRTDSTVTAAVGPDHRLTTLLVQRLREAGWRNERPLVLAATGSTDDRAIADVHQTARDLGDELGMDVPAAFVGGAEPRLSEIPAAAVATYLLAPGRFVDAVAASGAAIVAAPLGADPLIAEIILDRYDAVAPRVP
jgi:sirohydrochlorin ferrochelatase